MSRRQQGQRVLQLDHGASGGQHRALGLVPARGRGGALRDQLAGAGSVALDQCQPCLFQRQHATGVLFLGTQLRLLGPQRRQIGLGLSNGQLVVGRIDSQDFLVAADAAARFQIGVPPDHPAAHLADRAPAVGGAHVAPTARLGHQGHRCDRRNPHRQPRLHCLDPRRSRRLGDQLPRHQDARHDRQDKHHNRQNSPHHIPSTCPFGRLSGARHQNNPRGSLAPRARRG